MKLVVGKMYRYGTHEVVVVYKGFVTVMSKGRPVGERHHFVVAGFPGAFYFLTDAEVRSKIFPSRLGH